jgi:hypothetical protein
VPVPQERHCPVYPRDATSRFGSRFLGTRPIPDRRQETTPCRRIRLRIRRSVALHNGLKDIIRYTYAKMSPKRRQHVWQRFEPSFRTRSTRTWTPL